MNWFKKWWKSIIHYKKRSTVLQERVDFLIKKIAYLEGESDRLHNEITVLKDKIDYKEIVPQVETPELFVNGNRVDLIQVVKVTKKPAP